MRIFSKGHGRAIALGVVLAGAGITSVEAQRPDPWRVGFSGFLSIGPGIVSTDSQLSTNDDNERTSSLNDSGKSTNSFIPLVLGELRYTFASGNTQLYGGIPPGNAVEGDFLPEIGIRHRYADQTVLSLALLTGIPSLGEAWSDPFVVNQDRTKTDVSTFGARIGGEGLFGTGLALEYRYLQRDFDEERSGTFLGLNRVQRDLLDRDLQQHRVSAGYRIDLGSGISLKPNLAVTVGQAEGDANSYVAYRPEVTLAWVEGRWLFTANAGVGFAEYDKANPVFSRTREDDELGAQLSLGYAQPFNIANTRIDGIVGASRRDSNIGFYDSDTLIAGVLFGYSF